jgi:hypothetical protein
VDSQPTSPSAPSLSAQDLTQMLPMPFGQAAATDTMATTAAPLLAGFAFASLGFVLQVRDDVRWPDVALLLLVCTTLLLVMSVQANFHAKRNLVPPADWAAWLDLAPTHARREQLRRKYAVGISSYKRWGIVASRTYSVGIVILFASMAVLLVPPSTIGAWRAMAIGVAAVGAVGELVWTALIEVRRHGRQHRIIYRSSARAEAIRKPRLKPPA